MSRTLIVNADDFGRSPEITAGILRAHTDGIVTSASAMVRYPAAEPALRAAAEHPRLGVGLHLDLGEWALRDGDWVQVYDVVDLNDAAAVEREARAQLERFRTLAGREPTHIDSHQHVHRHLAAADVAARLAADLSVPLREHTPGIWYCGDFYGRFSESRPYPEGVTPTALVSLIENLPDGVTELGCHPGEDGVIDEGYGAERSVELRTLCDVRVAEAIARAKVTLASFTDVMLQRRAGS